MMRNTVILCAAIFLMANSVFAQENNQPSSENNLNIVTTASQNNKAIVFPCKQHTENKSDHSHFINSINNEVASKICGEKFFTAYFNEQYDKLALLKRCELSLKTVPLAIWNLNKYLENGIDLPYASLGISKLEDVKSFLAVDKLGKRKVVTVSHLYKQNRMLYALNTSLVSENNQLYALTTYDVDAKVFEPQDDELKKDIPEIIKRMQAKEEEKISNLTLAELDNEVRKNIWDEHINFVKKFNPSKIKKNVKIKE